MFQTTTERQADHRMTQAAPVTTADLVAAVHQARTLQQAGDLSGAERIYRAVLAADPRNFNALLLLGILTSQTDRLADALRLFETALIIDPLSAVAVIHQGAVLARMGRSMEALACFDYAVALQPDDAEGFRSRGNILRDLGRSAEALASYARALALRPELADVWINRGSLLEAMLRPEEALASYARALALRPDDAIAWFNHGNALQRLERYADAVASYQRAAALRPGFADALLNRGTALQELGRHADALAEYAAALAIDSGVARAWFLHGHALHKLDRQAEAVASFDRALALQPDLTEAAFERGNALQALQRLDEALASYDRALAVDPEATGAYLNRGNVLQQLVRHEAALAAFAAVIARRPTVADAHWNAALSHLTLGEFGKGWRGYEWRWKVEPYTQSKRAFAQPLWLGDTDLTGKTILLHAEQGFGDTLQFCRYAPLVARHAQVVLEVQPALRRLLGTLDGVTQIMSRGEALPPFDLHCPLLSLPLALGTTLAAIPGQVPYLRADPGRVAAWRTRVAELPGLRIGLVWAGDARKGDVNSNAIDRRRSITLNHFAPLAGLPGISLVSLQKGPTAAQAAMPPPGLTLHDWTNELTDFAETAALIEALDLVISVDTAVSHLVGALGRPVWLLNRFDTCWRWLLNRADSPWYPTMRIFRQTTRGDWDGVMGAVVSALCERPHPGPPPR